MQQKKKIGKNLQLKIDLGWRVEAGPTRKYVLMKKPQPDPIQPEFGPWGLNSTRLNPFFHPKNGFNPKNRVGFGRTRLNKPTLTRIFVYLKMKIATLHSQLSKWGLHMPFFLLLAPSNFETFRHLC